MTTASIIRGHYHRALSRHHKGDTTELALTAGESALTGALLGVASAKIKGGLDVTKNKIPMDLAAGVAGLAATLFIPEIAGEHDTVKHMAATAIGIGTFRKTEAYMKKKMVAAGEIEDAFDDGSTGMGYEDPIRVAARDL